MDCRELTVFFSKSDMNLARRDELPAIQRSCFELFPDELRIGSLDNMTASARRREFSKYALFPSADYENRFEERCEWVLRFVGKADLVVFSGSDLSQNYLEVSYLRSLMKPGASSRFLSLHCVDEIGGREISRWVYESEETALPLVPQWDDVVSSGGVVRIIRDGVLRSLQPTDCDGEIEAAAGDTAQERTARVWLANGRVLPYWFLLKRATEILAK